MPAMGAELYAHSPSARALLEQAQKGLQFDLHELVLSADSSALNDTRWQQPSVFITSLMGWVAAKERGYPRADYVVGHSLGQISALVASESLSLEDGLSLVIARGALMAKAGAAIPGGMAAVLGAEASEIAQWCVQASAESAELVQIANYNTPVQTIIAGTERALTRAMALAQANGAQKVTRLPISIPAHTPLMQSIVAEFGELVWSLPVNSPQIPVMSCLSAELLPAPRRIRHDLIALLTESVQWIETMRFLAKRGVDRLFETGPSDVLLKLQKRIDPTLQRAVITPTPFVK